MSRLSGVPAGWTPLPFIAGSRSIYTNAILDDWHIDPKTLTQGPGWYQTMYKMARTLLQTTQPAAAPPNMWIRRILNCDGIVSVDPTGKGSFRKGCVVNHMANGQATGILCVTPQLLQNDFSSRLDLLEEVVHSMWRPVPLARIGQLPPNLRGRMRHLHGQQFGGSGSPIPTTLWLPYNCHREIYEFQRDFAQNQLHDVQRGTWQGNAAFPQSPLQRDPTRFNNLIRRIGTGCHYTCGQAPGPRCGCDPEYLP